MDYTGSISLPVANFSTNGFWQSANILLTKPHVVNKRLWGSKVLFKVKCRPVTSRWSHPAHCRKLENAENLDLYMDTVLRELNLQQYPDPSLSVVEVILSELLPKNYSNGHAYQLSCLIREKTEIIFYDVTPTCNNQNLCPEFSYLLQLNGNELFIKALSEGNSKSFQWLQETVAPQFVKWGVECTSKTNAHFCNESLSLVSIEEYYTRYNELKLKHGKNMVEIWPECTDPSKFVYEDVAIATYLLLLWEQERKLNNSNSLQSFVDLGCGNGLLVYILTKEGYSGVGIDVRKRQIWEMFGSDTKLEEKTITPSDSHLFPETDWIIGNHSDELTPWIPVIAARSSYKCNFFLLPCCAYNFDGSRYQRQNSSKSQYTEYLEYIKNLCESVGFNTDLDRLKIPSTKRICLVGRGRTYNEHQYKEYCDHVQNILNQTRSSADDKDSTWIDGFISRDPVEKVKNCTQIDKNLIQVIVDNITDYLLDGCRLSVDWCIGKEADINELAQIIPQKQLKTLKSECGGLQTLIKNNHHIFKVQSGKVQLRYPKTVDEVLRDSKNNKNKAKIRVQSRPCWFNSYHPQGCPLPDVQCSFLHDKNR